MKQFTIQELKDYIKAIDIVEVLDKCEAIDTDDIAGRKIICPFHDENTPSLNFYEDSYYCFGCAASGDVFKFLMDIYDISFIQAAQLIAEKYEIDLKTTSNNPFLTKNNTSTKSLENEWKKYVSNLDNARDSVKQGASIFFPLEVGYDKDIRYYVLRYTSKTGKTLGFTKRRAFETDDKVKYPKWRHSNKDNTNISQCANIYNLGNAVKHIRQEKEVILVEGPKDTIPWIMEGKKNVVAVSGTHHFSNAYEVLPDFDRVILSLDSDGAGKKGMLDIALFLSEKMSLDNISYVDLDGMDPYDYYKANNKMPDSKPIFDLLTDEGLKALYDSSSLFNKELITTKYAADKSISFSEAESFFNMSKDEGLSKKKQEDEKQKLIDSKDPKALDKLRIKYGVE